MPDGSLCLFLDRVLSGRNQNILMPCKGSPEERYAKPPCGSRWRPCELLLPPGRQGPAALQTSSSGKPLPSARCLSSRGIPPTPPPLWKKESSFKCHLIREASPTAQDKTTALRPLHSPLTQCYLIFIHHINYYLVYMFLLSAFFIKYWYILASKT